jgi:hypothetical protein
VAKQFLNGAQVGALFEKVSAEGMTQSMGVDVGWKSAKNRYALHDAAHASRGEARILAGFAETAQLQADK